MIASTGHPTPSAAPDSPADPSSGPASAPPSCLRASVPSCLPPHRLLSSFLAHHCDPAAFAAAENLSAIDLLDWSANPAIQAHLTDLKRLIDHSLALRTAQASIAALDTLETVARSADDPIERRRAAASILRNTIPIRRVPVPPVPPNTASSGSCDAPRPAPTSIAELNDEPAADNDRSPRSRPAPTTTLGEPIPPLYAHAPLRFAPNPTLTPEDLVNTVSFALYTHRDPSCTAAIAAFLAPNATIANQPAPINPPDLAALDHLAPRAEPIHHQQFRSASAANASTHTIVLMHSRVPSTHYSLQLTRSDSGPNPGCWLIANLTRTSDTS